MALTITAFVAAFMYFLQHPATAFVTTFIYLYGETLSGHCADSLQIVHRAQPRTSLPALMHTPSTTPAL